MKVVAQCEHCEKAYRLPDKYCGKTIRCKGCGEAFEVPSLEDSLEESGMEEDFDPDEDEASPEPDPPKRKKASAKDSATRRKKASSKDSATRRRKRKKGKTDDDEDDSEEGRSRKDRSASAERKRKTSDSTARRRKTRSRKAVDKDEKAGKSDGSAEKKRGPKDSAIRRKKGPKDSATRKRKKDKKDDSAEAPGKKRTGAFKGKKSRSGGSGIRKTSALRRRGRGGGDGEDDGADKKRKMLMIGGGVGALVIVIIVAVLMSGPGGPDPATKKWYEEATRHLETAEGYRKIGSMSQASQTYESILAEIDKQSAKYPVDNPSFPKFKALVESARGHAPQAKELAELMVKINGGEGQEEVLGKVNDPDPAVRLAAIAMLRAKADEEPDFRKALSMLTRDSDPKVSEQAKQVLIQAGGRFAVPFLIEMLGSPNPTAQTRALEKIVAIEHEDAIPAIHKCLEILDPSKNAEDKGLALQLVNRLGEFASKDSVEPLEAFKSKTSGDLKGAVEAVIETCKGG